MADLYHVDGQAQDEATWPVVRRIRGNMIEVRHPTKTDHIAVKEVPKMFMSPKGSNFVVGDGVRWERYPGDSLWTITYSILYRGDKAGHLFQSLSYGRNAQGEGRWHASTRGLYWQYSPMLRRGGYDVAAFDSAVECLDAWGRSADEILDFSGTEAK